MSNLLLAEDDEFIRRLIHLRLTVRGHEIDQTVNGQEAVKRALSGNYDLILMDMHMPVMDGHKATHTLREKGYNRPIVGITASVMSAEIEKAIRSGCDACISKPLEPDFEDQVESLLAEHRIKSHR